MRNNRRADRVAAAIREEIATFLAGSAKDPRIVGFVTVTGVDLTSWGTDLGSGQRFGDLVAAILREVPDLRRLRLSSLDCIEIDDALLDALATQERLMPHLHLSLQAGDDLILTAAPDVVGDVIRRLRAVDVGGRLGRWDESQDAQPANGSGSRPRTPERTT